MILRRLLDLREMNNWTQTDVANRINISQRAYSHYEIGTRELPLEVLIKLADLYGTSTDYILQRTDVFTAYPKRSHKKTKHMNI